MFAVGFCRSGDSFEALFKRLPGFFVAILLINFTSAADAQVAVYGASDSFPNEVSSRYYFQPNNSIALADKTGQIDLTFPAGGYLSLGAASVGLNDADTFDPALTSLGFGREYSFGPGLVVDGALKYRIGDGLDSGLGAKVGVGYSRNDFNKFSLGGYGLSISADTGGGTTAMTFKASGYYDLHNGAKLSPFIGAGVGVANTNLDKLGRMTDDSDRVFAYKFSTGLDYSFNSQLSLKGEYKYFTNADPQYNAMGGAYNGHSVGFDLSYDF